MSGESYILPRRVGELCSFNSFDAVTIADSTIRRKRPFDFPQLTRSDAPGELGPAARAIFASLQKLHAFAIVSNALIFGISI